MNQDHLHLRHRSPLAYGKIVNLVGAALLIAALSWGADVPGGIQAQSSSSLESIVTYAKATVTPTATSPQPLAAAALPSAPPVGAGVPAHAFDAAGYASSTDACAACHKTHVAQGRPLQNRWPEENVCFSCHDGSRAPNIKSQFQKTYKMPIDTTAGIHVKEEARTKQGASFSGSSRHVECVDCHNPHRAAAGTHTPGTNRASGPLQDQWGVAATNVSPWTSPTLAPIWPVQYEYQVCFKCHSSWAYGSSPPTSPSGRFPETDQSKEFNTLNASYHPVEAPGKNPFIGPFGSYAGSLIGGFTPASTMYCSDCHGSETAGDPQGPHGSTKPFILKGDWSRTTGRNSRNGAVNDLCFRCHVAAVYTDPANESNPQQTGFSGEGKNLHAFMVGKKGKVCMDCHLAVPHGWNRPHLLGFNDDGAPYINRTGSGLQRVVTWQSPGNWTKDSCATAGSCH